MLVITSITVAFFLTINISTAKEQTPQEFVDTMFNTSIDIYKLNKTSPKKGMQASLDYISEHFAIVSSAKFVLGRSVRKFNKTQYEEFKTDLIAMLSYALRERIGGMPTKKFTVTGVITRGHSLFVSSKLFLNDGRILHGDWRIRKSSKTNKFLLQDIIIEGVSIIKSYKDSTAKQLKDANYDIPAFLKQKDAEVAMLQSGKIPKNMAFIKHK